MGNFSKTPTNIVEPFSKTPTNIAEPKKHTTLNWVVCKVELFVDRYI